MTAADYSKKDAKHPINVSLTKYIGNNPAPHETVKAALARAGFVPNRQDIPRGGPIWQDRSVPGQYNEVAAYTGEAGTVRVVYHQAFGTAKGPAEFRPLPASKDLELRMTIGSEEVARGIEANIISALSARSSAPQNPIRPRFDTLNTRRPR